MQSGLKSHKIVLKVNFNVEKSPKNSSLSHKFVKNWHPTVAHVISFVAKSYNSYLFTHCTFFNFYTIVSLPLCSRCNSKEDSMNTKRKWMALFVAHLIYDLLIYQPFEGLTRLILQNCRGRFRITISI